MEPTPTFREANRHRLRETLITAARELTVAIGWENVRMLDVAKAVGVSRQTVYNEFGGRPGLAEALAGTEIQRFTQGVRSELFAGGADVRSAGRAAILRVLTEAVTNPVVRDILTSTRSGGDGLLPYLTTRSELVLAAAGEVIMEWITAYLPEVAPAPAAAASDSIVRLTVSHLMTPSARPEATADTLADVLVRLLR
ncbi:TetR family transcriptional regulator [Micromonosporaceae bacterium Da 78-11]